MTSENKDRRPDTPLAERIAEACRGLNYMSETDAPVDPFVGGKVTGSVRKALAEVSGSGPRSRIEEADPEPFFSRLTTIKEWYTPEQEKNARGFAALERILRGHLADLRVFRVGRVRIDIYVVGTDRRGDLLGIKTRAVET
jgi:hypothetical protein